MRIWISIVVGAVLALAGCGAPEFSPPTPDERAVFDEVNHERAAGFPCADGARSDPLPRLAWSDALAHAAREHARALDSRAAWDRWGHYGPVGDEGCTEAKRDAGEASAHCEDPGDRIRTVAPAGAAPAWRPENLHLQLSYEPDPVDGVFVRRFSARQAIDDWLGSPGHCLAMQQDYASGAGVGIVRHAWGDVTVITFSMRGYPDPGEAQ